MNRPTDHRFESVERPTGNRSARLGQTRSRPLVITAPLFSFLSFALVSTPRSLFVRLFFSFPYCSTSPPAPEQSTNGQRPARVKLHVIVYLTSTSNAPFEALHLNLSLENSAQPAGENKDRNDSNNVFGYNERTRGNHHYVHSHILGSTSGKSDPKWIEAERPRFSSEAMFSFRLVIFLGTSSLGTWNAYFQ